MLWLIVLLALGFLWAVFAAFLLLSAAMFASAFSDREIHSAEDWPPSNKALSAADRLQQTNSFQI